MERLTTSQPKIPPFDHEVQGMEFSHMFIYKSKRGLKRNEDSKETYKLPHRLIEKKRRDRINECIAQLKDMLPEHLKLTTLGHLEKAVVLELTLKHVKALSSLIEQQQQKILALQNGIQIGEQMVQAPETGHNLFQSGFQTCAKEVLQYLAKHENSRDVKPSHLISHLQSVGAELLPGEYLNVNVPASGRLPEEDYRAKALSRAEGHGKNCVPVIQRTCPAAGGEQSGSDTDTDSGYGGEPDKGDSKHELERAGGERDGKLKHPLTERMISIKREYEEPLLKKPRMEPCEDDMRVVTGDLSGGGFLAHHPPPLCLPFYLLPPSAAAAYMPMLEKCWYPTSMPVLYPGISGPAALTGLMSPDKLSPLLMPPRPASPISASPAMDTSALIQALKHVPSLAAETKD
ncbi:class E basic helix-loop-helix protein 40 [Callorhinchus milii]|uniref:Class E basic helix-loop-helix protein 40-like protein n=1 Tax=Callorhinchus milii TaxID=7868 RepID=V9KUW4_CALMI|nr:class E basic helix-loop-helix protein 40 [Callorhinchus milii]